MMKYQILIVLALTCPAMLVNADNNQVLEEKINALTEQVTQQEQRIQQLERLVPPSYKVTIKSVPTDTIPEKKTEPEQPKWLSADAWKAIKPGMNRQMVESILGKPSVEKVDIVDNVSLIYRLDDGEKTLRGTVVITYVNRVEFRGIFPPKF